MIKFEVTFKDSIIADSEEQAYDMLLNYLGECVANGDVTAFNFEVIKP